jgi:hypothetical protein
LLGRTVALWSEADADAEEPAAARALHGTLAR